jgi:hypothetical protein
MNTYHLKAGADQLQNAAYIKYISQNDQHDTDINKKPYTFWYVGYIMSTANIPKRKAHSQGYVRRVADILVVRSGPMMNVQSLY